MYNAQLKSAMWLNEAMAKVYGLMSFNLFITALVAMLTYNVPEFQAVLLGTWVKWVVLLAPIAIVLVMSLGYEKLGTGSLYALFLMLAVTVGLSLSTIGNMYKTTDIISALVTSVALFVSMSGWAYFTKRDLSGWGNLLFFGLLGLIIAMVVNVFVGGTVMAVVISMVGVVIFLGLIAYDTQTIRNLLWESKDDEANKAVVMGSLSLYLNLINLFMFILRLMGLISGDD